MSSKGIPKINELPLSPDFIPGDKIIIDRDNKGYLIDYDNLLVGINQISFQQDIINDTNEVDNLQQYSIDKYNELVKELTEKNIGRSTAHLIDLTNTISEGTLSSASYREFITSTETPFIGPNNLVVFDSALVDKLSISIEGTTTESTECDIDRVIFGQGTIAIPKGTYRIRASISLSPEVNLNLDQDTLDEYIKRKQQVWSYLSFVQLTNPERTILNGSGSSTYTNIGQSITLTLNGYFYTDRPRQYGLKVHTLGKLYPGVVTGTYSQNTDSGVVDNNYLSISDLFGREQFNQSRILIERISDTDTLSPLEDSPQGFRSQALAIQPRVPLTYNAGWLQKINAQDTSVVPASSLFVITALPFNKSGNNYVGDLRGYITEPKSYQGYIKIGDTVRYRRQRLNSQGVLSSVFTRYDVRDSELKIPLPGWYGLIVDETTKKVGEKYDTIFRVDINGVVSQRQYIADPASYYRRCITGDPETPPTTTTTTTLRPPTPPIVTTTTTTTTTTRPPSAGGPTTTTSTTTRSPTTTTTTTTRTTPRPLLVPGEQFVVANNTGADRKTWIVPSDMRNAFVHAVCIGGGEGGFKTRKPLSSGQSYERERGGGGQGGSLAWRNNILVQPGDTLILIAGGRGNGTSWENRNGEQRKGGNSELRIIRYSDKSKTEELLLRARGGGRPDVSPTPLSTDSRGGNGSLNKYIDGGGQGGAQLQEFIGGGGGAGGYRGDGSGGNGGREGKGEPGSGGAGGGGGSKNGLAGRGGGVGFYGRDSKAKDNDNGKGGAANLGNDNPPESGGQGSVGNGDVDNINYGGGGRGVRISDNEDRMEGGLGAVRIIWGTGRSFPFNAK